MLGVWELGRVGAVVTWDPEEWGVRHGYIVCRIGDSLGFFPCRTSLELQADDLLVTSRQRDTLLLEPRVPVLMPRPTDGTTLSKRVPDEGIGCPPLVDFYFLELAVD